MHSKTVSNKDTNNKSSAKATEINDIGLVIQEGLSVEVSRAVSASAQKVCDENERNTQRNKKNDVHVKCY